MIFARLWMVENFEYLIRVFNKVWKFEGREKKNVFWVLTFDWWMKVKKIIFVKFWLGENILDLLENLMKYERVGEREKKKVCFEFWLMEDREKDTFYKVGWKSKWYK